MNSLWLLVSLMALPPTVLSYACLVLEHHGPVMYIYRCALLAVTALTFLVVCVIEAAA